MKLYKARVQDISTKVVKIFNDDGSIEVSTQNFHEVVQDLSAIMLEFLRRDSQITKETKDRMNKSSVSFDQFGKQRSKLAKREKHPIGNDVEKYLSRQFIESFMMSKFVDEVYAEDSYLYKTIIKILETYHVNEEEIREEAKLLIKNIKQGTVEYEMSLSDSIRAVKRKKGLIK